MGQNLFPFFLHQRWEQTTGLLKSKNGVWVCVHMIRINKWYISVHVLSARRGKGAPSLWIKRSVSCSLIFVLLFLLAIWEGRTGAQLPVAIQPLLHHLCDERMAPPPRALLQRHQDSTLRHATVQPLPQQTLLLILCSHLIDVQNNLATYQQMPYKTTSWPILHSPLVQTGSGHAAASCHCPPKAEKWPWHHRPCWG